MDQAPGPTIANPAANVACARAIHPSPGEYEANRAIAIPTFAIPASAPATGVKKPINRNIADAIPIICNATINGGGPSRMLLIPK